MAKTQKLLLNGESGTGKTSLLSSLTNALVFSRDGKDFTLPIPHACYKEFPSMEELIEGYTGLEETVDLASGKVEEKEVYIKGFIDILESYREAYSRYPETIVIDSVSKLTNDIMEKGNTDFTDFAIHAYIKKDLSLLNKFITEYLTTRCTTVILVNHVVKKDGTFQQTGSGNFKDKGGFYAEVDEAITLVNTSNKKRKVITRGGQSQARTLLDVPTEIPVPFIDPFDKTNSDEITEEHFNLQAYLDLMHESSTEASKWELT